MNRSSLISGRHWFRCVLGAGLFGLVHGALAGQSLTNCNEAGLRLALSQTGSVMFACSGTITLGSPIVISNQVTLDAAGSDVTLAGGGTNRLFEVESGGELHLIGLTLRGGRATGTDGLDGTEAGQSGRAGQRANGGAILIHGGSVRITQCVLRDNVAQGGDGGDGFVAGGCDAPGNGGAGGLSFGGAIHMNNGALFIEKTTIRDNAAVGGDGGEGGAAASCSFGSDGASGGSGGHGYGGAIHVENGMLEVENCSFFQNRAFAGNGGAGGHGAGGLGEGGNGGDGAVARGGSLYADRGVITLLSCTLALETCQAGLGGAPGLGDYSSLDGDRGDHGIYQGDCIHAARTSVMISHCIVDGAHRLRNCTGAPATAGRMVDAGYNLSSDGSVVLDATGLMRTDPLLPTLAEIGPGTLALELATNSPAIDRGDPANAPVGDQFGTSRVGLPDLGALESIQQAVTVELRLLLGQMLEGETNDVIEICRSGPLERPLTVNFAFSGEATNMVDYELLSEDANASQIVIAPGNACLNLSLSAVVDAVFDPREEITLMLLPGFYSAGLVDTVTFAIVDPAVRPVLEGEWNDDGEFAVSFDVLTNTFLSNAVFTLESSSNLVDWTLVGSFHAFSNIVTTNLMTNVVFTNRGVITDAGSVDAPARFYRLVVE